MMTNKRSAGKIFPGNLIPGIRYFAPFAALLVTFMLLLSLGVSAAHDANAAREKEENTRTDEPGGNFGEAIYVEADRENDGNVEQASEAASEISPNGDRSTTVTLLLQKDGKAQPISMEEYLTGVLLAEVPASYDAEALKAQAVAARTYCLYRMERGSGKASHESGADVCGDYRHCMAYIDPVEAAPAEAAKMREAAEATKGLCVVYTPSGALIDAVFHDSSHLSTESALAVWNSDVPYLRAVSSPEQCTVKNYEFTAEEIFRLTLGDNASPGNGNFGGMTADNAGRTEKVLIAGKEFTALQLRSALSLPSTAFTVLYDEAAGLYRFAVRGYGHGVGLSQQGAAQMAKDGAKFDEILRHYYSDCEVVSYVYEQP